MGLHCASSFQVSKARLTDQDGFSCVQASASVVKGQVQILGRRPRLEAAAIL